jgi:NADH-quinone oxidoreductase subunit G
MHFVLDRPHLNEGARVQRLKPRYNADVNEWWMCDEGRYGFGWIDHDRLTKVRHQGVESTWDQAIAALVPELLRCRDNGGIGVIASSKLTVEELFLMREIFQVGMGSTVAASFPALSGSSDSFLIKADKNPNTLGAALLGLSGPGVPDAAGIVAQALEGRIESLWVFGHDLGQLCGNAAVEQLSRKLRLFVFSGTNENPALAWYHWVLPTAAYVEKDGTFVNCHGRIQRIGRAFPPLGDSREDWRLLLELAAHMNLPLTWRNPNEIFLALAAAESPFAGLTYDTIGFQGAMAALPAPVGGAAAS